MIVHHLQCFIEQKERFAYIFNKSVDLDHSIVTCLFGRWQVSFVVFFNFVIYFDFINLKFYFHHLKFKLESVAIVTETSQIYTFLVL